MGLGFLRQKIIKQKDMGYIIILMEKDMKENGKILIEKDMYTFILMGIDLKENI